MSRKNMKDSGVTLLEVLMVMATAGALVVALSFTYEGWQGRYNVESQIKEIFDDLLDVRVAAMRRNRMYFATLSTTDDITTLTVYEDNNPSPDGNGTLDTATPTDRLVSQKDFEPTYSVTWEGGDQMDFNTRGMYDSDTDKAICIFSEMTPDYDCLVISTTRINIGKISDQGGACAAANCETK